MWKGGFVETDMTVSPTVSACADVSIYAGSHLVFHFKTIFTEINAILRLLQLHMFYCSAPARTRSHGSVRRSLTPAGRPAPTGNLKAVCTARGIHDCERMLVI